MSRHETADGLRETEEKQNMSCATNEETGMNSGKPDDDRVAETVIWMPEELPKSNSCQSRSPEAAAEGKEERESWVVQVVKCGDEGQDVWEGGKVCRICHLDLEEEAKDFSGSKSEPDLIRLGCGCKGELSCAHSCCAEAWFKIKGNRKCEICGQIVSNVKGTENEAFFEEWMGGGVDGEAFNLSQRNERCWNAKPFCNFVMACLVMAFILPWFFRVSIF